VRRLHEKLFYRPLLAAAARIPTEELRLTADAARARLTALGFADPDGALRHLAALTDGVSRRAAIQRALLPALLGSFADAPDPDGGLLGYRQVSEALQDTPWYLRLLRDDAKVADRLTVLLGSSRYVADLFVRDPEGLQLLAEDERLAPRPADVLRTTMRSAIARNEDPVQAIAAIRAARRRELLRIACADLLDLIDVAVAGDALSSVAATTLDAALEVAARASYPDGSPARLAVISMGRLGGGELGYGSDVDVLFVYEPVDGAEDRAAGAAATAIVESVRRMLAGPAPDPPLTVDADLRPEGRSGPLVRSLASYAAYYERWSSTWEAQALLRASAAAGDADLGSRFLQLIDPLRYPANGLPAAAVLEIRRLKARVDAERLPRGADPATHTKLGRGGIADVEWTVQLLQLQHGAVRAELRTPSTLQALRGLVETGALEPDDAAALEAAWRLASRARNAIMLVRGRAEDQLPRYGTTLASVMRVLGYPPDRDPGQFLDDYRRATRRARMVIERVFYA
jgi:glutamate-ammonia-ligase adenylyltransferase